MDFLNWFRGKKKKISIFQRLKKKGFKNKKCIIFFFELKVYHFQTFRFKRKTF